MKKNKNLSENELKGIDISESAVKLARDKGINAKIGDIEEGLPFNDVKFHVIFCLQVIEHVFDTDMLLNECKNALVDEGYLILSTFNLASILNRIKLLFGYLPNGIEYEPNGAGHIRAYTLPRMKKQLQRLGFEIIKVRSPNFHYPEGIKLLKPFAQMLGYFFPSICGHFVILAKKK